LFPLAFEPMLSGEDYFTRKGNYAVKGLIICNDYAKITWVEMGWPGSVHDNRVWLNVMCICRKKNTLITSNTCLVIQHSLHLQFWSPHSKRAAIPTLETIKATLIQSWRKYGLRASTVWGC